MAKSGTIAISDEQKRIWSHAMQRRIMRFLLLHDRSTFGGRFRALYAYSDVPLLPVLRQYDRYLKLVASCDELLDDIMPRIRLGLSLSTSSTRLLELPPTRGEIEWERTARMGQHTTPGLAPLLFSTRLCQRDMATPENLLAVAILQEVHAQIEAVRREEMEDEELGAQELELLASIDERVERELAAAYARLLVEKAQQFEVSDLVAQVEQRLRPGLDPYCDLIAWREQWQALRVGTARGRTTALARTLASARDVQQESGYEARLYQLWIFLEFVHLLIDEGALLASDITPGRAEFTFVWGKQRRQLRLRYDRRHPQDDLWENAPSVRPDYLIERVGALRVPPGASDEEAVWSEPAVMLDAKYYLAGESQRDLLIDPLKKMLADMALTRTRQVILFFPTLLLKDSALLPLVMRQKDGRHPAGWQEEQEVRLDELAPGGRIDAEVQTVLRAALDAALAHLPVRDQPVCEGVRLDPASVNVSGRAAEGNIALCPRRHIGAHIFDLVHIERDCLRNQKLCHVIGQPGVFPLRVVLVSTCSELHEESQRLRQQYETLLQAASGDEKARLCTHLLDTVGRLVEQYVARHGSTQAIEDTFRDWIFHRYWDQEAWALAAETRGMLVSGEYVWYEYQQSSLDDWAAPAVQYCRALEYEIRRRLYQRHAEHFVLHRRQAWTLGTLDYLYRNRQSGHPDVQRNRGLVMDCITCSGTVPAEFDTVLARFVGAGIVRRRNELAHGDPVLQSVARDLRHTILGDRSQEGILAWLVTHVAPV